MQLCDQFQPNEKVAGIYALISKVLPPCIPLAIEKASAPAQVWILWITKTQLRVGGIVALFITPYIHKYKVRSTYLR